MKQVKFKLRKGTPDDAEQVIELIKGLAAFEKAPHEVINTPGKMRREFDYFRLLVVENPEGEIVAFALYYPVYYTWKGKSMYIDDIYVKEDWRGNGIGTMLLEKIMEEATAEGMNRLRWQVLDWNKPAIEFYKKYGVRFDDEWINCDWYPPQKPNQ